MALAHKQHTNKKMQTATRSPFIEPITFKKHVRTRFLEIAATVKPQAFRELAGKPFELLELAQMNQALSPIFEPDFRWSDFETGADNLSAARKDLRDCLIAWQTENYLLESEDSEKWLLRWLVESGVEFQSRIERSKQKIKLREKIKCRFLLKRYLRLKGELIETTNNETSIFRRVEIPSGLPSLSVYEPPAFLTYNHFRDVLETEQKLSGYIEIVRQDFEKRLGTFRCDMESYLATNGGFEIKDENLLRDLLWTAESQLNDALHSHLASVGKVEPSNKLKKQKLVNPLKIKKSDLEIIGVSDTTVSRAVIKTLKMLGLEPHPKDIGRPRGKRQDAIDKLLLE